MFDKVVCIDMGSSYTKIAVRRSANSLSEPIGAPGGSASVPWFIPSMVAAIERSGKVQYVFGATAAAQRGGVGVRRYHNWKATLFTPGAAGDAKLGHTEAIELAVRFLTFLRGQVLEDRQLERFPVRLCAPDLAGSKISPDVLASLMSEAGMTPHDELAVVDEPSSNAVGVLTRGRNAVWTPPQQSYMPPPPRQLALQKMFEPQLSSKYQQHGYAGTDGKYRVLITDLGAYTTDFALVTFETGFGSDEYKRPAILQESQPIGVSQLDHAVLESCSTAGQRAIAATSQSDWEQRKVALYAGEVIALAGPNATTVRIGAGPERDAIVGHLQAHAKRVIAAKRAFLRRHDNPEVNEEIFSGGGAAIELIRSQLRKASTTKTITDLLDPEEPARSVLGKARLSLKAQEDRHDENRRLTRVGSAIGGASVFFG